MVCKTLKIYNLYYIFFIDIFPLQKKAANSFRQFFQPHPSHSAELSRYHSHSRGPPTFPHPEYYYSEHTPKDDSELLEGETGLVHFCITTNPSTQSSTEQTPPKSRDD